MHLTAATAWIPAILAACVIIIALGAGAGALVLALPGSPEELRVLGVTLLYGGLAAGTYALVGAGLAMAVAVAFGGMLAENPHAEEWLDAWTSRIGLSAVAAAAAALLLEIVGKRLVALRDRHQSIVRWYLMRVFDKRVTKELPGKPDGDPELMAYYAVTDTPFIGPSGKRVAGWNLRAVRARARVLPAKVCR